MFITPDGQAICLDRGDRRVLGIDRPSFPLHMGAEVLGYVMDVVSAHEPVAPDSALGMKAAEAIFFLGDLACDKFVEDVDHFLMIRTGSS